MASNNEVPDWLKADLFEEVLKQTVQGFIKIKDFQAQPALSAGGNFATMIFCLKIDIEMENNKTKNVTFMLKLPHDGALYNEFVKNHNIFGVENGMYFDVIPEMEEMYRNVGLDIQFGAQSYKLPIAENYVLLEDLCTHGFKNTNRLEGLDMEHTKCVLKKLAQWHAASATRADTKHKYDDIYCLGMFKESQKEIMKRMNEMMGETGIKALRMLRNNEIYIEALEKLRPKITDELFKTAQIDPNEFNVLNHGDCWSNNIMFQYDDFGNIKETYLLDFQIPKYGTPAQDLYYFLLSSTKLEIKLKKFDYFVKYYHDELVEHLKLLKYPKKLPTLKDIHIALHKNSIWGFSSVVGVMAVVLVDPTESASFENFLNDTAEGIDFKMLMYANERYQKHAEAVLPWLYYRGALEY